MRSIDNWYSSSTSNSCRFIIMNKHILFQRRDGRENLITFWGPMLYQCCPRDGYRDVISAGLSRFGDPRRRSATAVAVPRQPSPFRDSRRRSSTAVAVPRQPSPFRDSRRRSATAVAVPRQLSRYGEAASCAMQAIAAHLAVPRPRFWPRQPSPRLCNTPMMSNWTSQNVCVLASAEFEQSHLVAYRPPGKHTIQ